MQAPTLNAAHTWVGAQTMPEIVCGNHATPGANFVYSYAGAGPGTTRAGVQMHGPNQSVSFYTASTWRGGYDAKGHLAPGPDNT